MKKDLKIWTNERVPSPIREAFHRLIAGLCLGAIAVPVAMADPPPPLPLPRTFHRAVTFEDKIFVFGGTYPENNQFLILDLKEEKWIEREAPFKQGLAFLTAVAGETLYVVDPFTPKLRSYDPNENDWTDLAPPPRARGNPALVGYAGKLYLIGSYLNVPAEHSVEVYDPETDKWSTAPPLPEIEKEHHFHLTAVLDGRLHVVGYYFGGKSHWAFDGEKWEARAEAPVECGWKMDALEAVDDGLLLLKPYFPDRGEKPPENPEEIFHYVADDDRWEVIGSLPEGYPFICAANAVADGHIYVIGGDPEPTAVFRYDVAKKTWERSLKRKAN